jgi:carbamoyltransferase
MRILAFNIAHDSSVCSFVDGKIEFFCKEERLTGIKRDKHPFKSIELYESLKLGKIDHILYLTPSNNEKDVEFVWKTYIEKKFNKEIENFSSLLHHECHANLAYHNSKFEEALIFVIDRNGSMFFINGQVVARESESIFVGNKNKIKPILKNFWLELNKDVEKINILNELKKYYYDCEISLNNSLSIVKVYEAATTLIGQHPLENGKTMGLSSYGKKYAKENLFIENIPNANKFSFLNDSDNSVCFYNCESLITKNINSNNYKFYADKCKLVQTETQEQVLRLIKKYVKFTGIKNVCIVGGYGLNVVANNYYIENLSDVKFYFEPVADDTGIPIGAAMLKYKQETSKNVFSCVNNFYHYYKEENINEGINSDIKEVCKLIENQKSVAIFDGNPESGPRALGHRSILFDPRNENCKKIVNNIKNREWYRPFAGVIIKSYLYDYFENLPIDESPYMTINFKYKKNLKIKFPGIIHVDNTCRVQTVEQGNLYDILNLFNERNNCPILLNTSFNLAGKPLVHTIKDAISTWKESSLDAVYFVNQKKLLIK